MSLIDLEANIYPNACFYSSSATLLGWFFIKLGFYEIKASSEFTQNVKSIVLFLKKNVSFICNRIYQKMNRIQKLIMTEYSEFEDVILIESPSAQVSLDGTGIRSVQIGQKQQLSSSLTLTY